MSLGFAKLKYCNWQPLPFLSSSTDMYRTVFKDSSIIPQVYLDSLQNSFITSNVISERYKFPVKWLAMPVTLFTPTSVFSAESFPKVFVTNPCKNYVSYIWKNVFIVCGKLMHHTPAFQNSDSSYYFTKRTQWNL
jgi:hypothetical protein